MSMQIRNIKSQGDITVADMSVTKGSMTDNSASGFLAVTGQVGSVKYLFGREQGTGSAKFYVANGEYGTLTVHADGSWTYILDNNLASVQGLGAGENMVDHFKVRMEDDRNTNNPDDDYSRSIELNVSVLGQADSPTAQTKHEAPKLTSVGGPYEIEDTYIEDSPADLRGRFTATDANDNHDQRITFRVKGAIADKSEVGYTHSIITSYGWFFFNESNGEWKFKSNSAAVNEMLFYEERKLVFYVTAHDTINPSNTETLEISFTGDNDRMVGTFTHHQTIADTENAHEPTEINGVTEFDSDDFYKQSVNFNYVITDIISGKRLGRVYSQSPEDGVRIIETDYGRFEFYTYTGSWKFVVDEEALDSLGDGQIQKVNFDIRLKNHNFSGNKSWNFSHQRSHVFTFQGVNDTPTITLSNNSDFRITKNSTTDTAGGLILMHDPEGDNLTLQVRIKNNGAEEAEYVNASNTENSGKGVAVNGKYGALYLKEDGSWTYELSKTASQSTALVNMEPDDIDDDPFEVNLWDGNTNSGPVDLIITVKGDNSAPTISMPAKGVDRDAREDDEANGHFAIDDGDDNTNDELVVQGRKRIMGTQYVDGSDESNGGKGAQIAGIFGTLYLKADGTWVYSVDRNNQNTRDLDLNELGTDKFEFRVWDGDKHSSNTIPIDILVKGDANKHPTFVSENAGSSLVVAEDSNVRAEGTYTLADDSNSLVIQARNKELNGGFDVGDNSANGGKGTAILGKYGTLFLKGVVAKSANWTYELDNSRTLTQSLDKDSPGQESFEVRVFDGLESSSTTLSITVMGANDAPEIFGGDTLYVASIYSRIISGVYMPTDVDEGDNPIAQVQWRSETGERSGYISGDNDANNSKGAAIPGRYGTLYVRENGHWTYELDYNGDEFRKLQNPRYYPEFEDHVDVYYFRAWDGLMVSTNETTELTFNPRAHNDAPSIEVNDMIAERGVVNELFRYLSASDIDIGTEASDLTYRLVRASHSGMLKKKEGIGSTNLETGDTFTQLEVENGHVWVETASAGIFSVFVIDQYGLTSRTKAIAVSIDSDPTTDSRAFEVYFQLADDGTVVSAVDESHTDRRFHLGRDKLTIVDTTGVPAGLNGLLGRMNEVSILYNTTEHYRGIEFGITGSTTLTLYFAETLNASQLKDKLGITSNTVLNSIFESGRAPDSNSNGSFELNSIGHGYITALFGTDLSGQANIKVVARIPTIIAEQGADLQVSEDGDNEAEGSFTLLDYRGVEGDGIIARGRKHGSPNQFDDESSSPFSGQSTVISGIYGTLNLGLDGEWTYELDSTNSKTQGLRGREIGIDQFEIMAWSTVDQKASNPATLVINVIGAEDAPTLDPSPPLTLNPEVSMALARHHLDATDADTGPAGLTYTITAPRGATLEKHDGTSWTALATGATFTQADVDAGHVRLTAMRPGSFTVALSDGTTTLDAVRLSYGLRTVKQLESTTTDVDYTTRSGEATSTSVTTGAGVNEITPGTGNDRVDPGAGDDRVELSRGGSDQVVYRTTLDADGYYTGRDGTDDITGFTPGDDQLLLAVPEDQTHTALGAFLAALGTGYRAKPVFAADGQGGENATGFEIRFAAEAGSAGSRLDGTTLEITFATPIARADFEREWLEAGRALGSDGYLTADAHGRMALLKVLGLGIDIDTSRQTEAGSRLDDALTVEDGGEWTVFGAEGDDTITLGSGTEKVVYRVGVGSSDASGVDGTDTVTNFTLGTDSLAFVDTNATGGTASVDHLLRSIDGVKLVHDGTAYTGVVFDFDGSDTLTVMFSASMEVSTLQGRLGGGTRLTDTAFDQAFADGSAPTTGSGASTESLSSAGIGYIEEFFGGNITVAETLPVELI